MEYEFDSAKDKANQAKHGISLSQAEGFNWDTATITSDTRANYSEQRFIAQGYIGTRLHILIFTPRGACCRVISLRKSNARERTSYEKAT